MNGREAGRRRGRATTQRGIGVVVGVILLSGVVFTLVVGVTMFRNDRAFDDWRARLVDKPPPGLTVVDSGRRFGILAGSGNHCDGEAWIALSGDATRRQVSDHYRGLPGLTVEREDADRWRVTMADRLGPAGLDPRCH